MTEAVAELPCYLGGEPVHGEAWIEVRHPYDGSLRARVAGVGREAAARAVEIARAARCRLTHDERAGVLERARAEIAAAAEDWARTITAESGLCLADARHEVARAGDVLLLAAREARAERGESLACDVTPHGASRRIFTVREPHAAAVAITPFNHPLNQVLHKVAPAIAAGTPLVLKPSERTPVSALRCAELLYRCGLPGEMLSVVVGETTEVAESLVRDARVEVLLFTGSVATGKHVAAIAGYKKLVLELGGCSPLIVLADGDLERAVEIAVRGAFGNSGQRCTAIKRVLVEEPVAEAFAERLTARARELRCGDPFDPRTDVGTVISEAAAAELERMVVAAERAGARVRCGGRRRGALMPPTVLERVPRDAEIVTEEAFGPLAPIVSVRDLDDAIEVANASRFGLACGIVTDNLASARRAIREIRTGTVNVNEAPGFRIESSPFGGVKDSGLGVKEGVVEAIRALSWTKTFSLPW